MAYSSEVWRTIPRYPSYEASSKGRVRRKQHRYYPMRRGPILSTFAEKRKGYIRVCVGDLTQDLAPLICEAFHGIKPSEKHQAAHRDGDKANNRPDNLAWLTQEENYQDQVRHGTDRKGERSGHAKLTKAKVLAIRRAVARGVRGTQRRFARRLGVSETTVSRIILGRTWSHV